MLGWLKSLVLHVAVVACLGTALAICGWCDTVADLQVRASAPDPTPVPRTVEGVPFGAILATADLEPEPGRDEAVFLGGSETIHRVNGGWILLRVQEFFVPDREAPCPLLP